MLAARLNEEGRAYLIIVGRFGMGDKWLNIAKRDFFEIVPVEGLVAWLECFRKKVEAVSSRRQLVDFSDEIIATNLKYSVALRRPAADLRFLCDSAAPRDPSR